MKLLRVLALSLLAVTPLGGAAAERDVVAEVLDKAGIERRELTPDPVRLLASRTGSATPPILRGVLTDPLRAPYRVGLWAASAQERLDSPHRLLLQSAALAGIEGARGYFGNPFRGIDLHLAGTAQRRGGDPLREALTLLQRHDPGWPIPPVPSVQEFPDPWRLEVARLLAILAFAEDFRQRGLRELPPGFDASSLLLQLGPQGTPAPDPKDYRVALPKIEREALLAAGLDVAAALEDFDDARRRFPPPPAFHWEAETPLGTVLLSAEDSSDSRTLTKALLLVDWRGDDVHHFPVRADRAAPLSVAFDAAGNDVWHGCAGGAVLGVAALWDAAGDDRYEGGDVTQGGALGGVALSVDLAGNDVYAAGRFAQGAAFAGVALSFDGGGNDARVATSWAQAAGGPLGAGVLVDADGSDTYTLANAPLSDPSPQSRQHNASRGQGCGMGIRADLNDGRSLAGGAGVLLDFAGDDSYSAQVFAQGVGFYEGFGALVDAAGADRYHAVWYAQGSATHRAGAVLLDLGVASDSYRTEFYSGIAAGHDVSVAVLLDEGGNDSYFVRNFGVGSAADNGIALLCDVAGDDSYTVQEKASHALGHVEQSHWGTAREAMLGAALFFDLGGRDTYRLRTPGGVAEGALWASRRRFPELKLEAERGAGIDTTAPNPFTLRPRTPSDPEDEKQFRSTLEERRRYRQRKP